MYSSSKNKREKLLSRKRNILPQNLLPKEEEIPLNEIPELIQTIAKGDEVEKELCVSDLKTIASSKNPPFEIFIENKLNEVLVDLLNNSQNESLIYDALWITVKFSTSTNKQTNYLYQSGSLPALMKFINGKELISQEMSFVSLGNILNDSIECREEFLQKGYLDNIVSMYNEQHPKKIYQYATWLLAQVCRSLNENNQNTFLPLVTIFNNLLEQNDQQNIRLSCDGICYLMSQKKMYHKLIENRVFKKLINILNYLPLKNLKTSQSVLVTISQIFKVEQNKETVLQILGESDLLSVLQKIVEDTSNLYFEKKENQQEYQNTKSFKNLIPEILYILRRIIRNDTNIIHILINHDLILCILQFLQNNSQLLQAPELALDFCWFMAYFCKHGDDEQCLWILESGAISSISSILIFHKNDTNVLIPALLSINHLILFENQKIANFIEQYNCFDIIDPLSNHSNKQISSLSEEIIDGVFIIQGKLLFDENFQDENY